MLNIKHWETLDFYNNFFQFRGGEKRSVLQAPMVVENILKYSIYFLIEMSGTVKRNVTCVIFFTY